MGKYPVICLSLKDIAAADYDTAFALAVQVINEVVYRFYPQMKESSRLLPEEKELLSRFIRTDLTEAEFTASLRILSRLTEKHYGQKTVILIDEYDVPLAKAYENGYDDRMLLVRNLFQQGLNAYLNQTISIRDSAVRTALKENFYHGLLLGILGVKDSRMVESNRESGDGYCDIRVRDNPDRFAMIMEVKYADAPAEDSEAGYNDAAEEVNIFSVIPNTFDFSSGAGAWAAKLYLNDDGTRKAATKGNFIVGHNSGHILTFERGRR